MGSYSPAGRLGRRRALQSVSAGLRAAGVRGHAVSRVERVHLPFWQLEAKLVGWQRFREPTRPVSRDPQTPAWSVEPEAGEWTEETLAREIHYSLPACDVRGYGLVGIADRVSRLRWRPFSLDRVTPGEMACAVTTSRAAILRQARLYHAARLAPRGKGSVRQKVSFIRSRLRLLYYPLWRVAYTVSGQPHQAVVDGVQGTLLRASCPQRLAASTPAWLGVGAVAGVLAGVSPVLAGTALAAWVFHRGHRAEVAGGLSQWGGWLSRELGGARWRVRQLEDDS